MQPRSYQRKYTSLEESQSNKISLQTNANRTDLAEYWSRPSAENVQMHGTNGVSAWPPALGTVGIVAEDPEVPPSAWVRNGACSCFRTPGTFAPRRNALHARDRGHGKRTIRERAREKRDKSETKARHGPPSCFGGIAQLGERKGVRPMARRAAPTSNALAAPGGARGSAYGASTCRLSTQRTAELPRWDAWVFSCCCQAL